MCTAMGGFSRLFRIVPFSQQSFRFFVKLGQIILQNGPHPIILDFAVTMYKDVSEGDNFLKVGNVIGQVRLSFFRLK